MSEDIDVEGDKVLVRSENEVNKSETSPEVVDKNPAVDNENVTSSETENDEKNLEISPTEKPEEESTVDNKDIVIAETKNSIESKHTEDNVDSPPPIEKSDFMWCDNYDFLEDEKIAINYEDDPQKAILLAAQNNELEILRKLLEVDQNLVNARDNDLYTPLHRAAYSNNVEVIRILLSYDADIRARTIDGWEPLHCACKWDSVEAVSLLIQNGADVNAQTNGHITPLHLAASNVHGRRTLELLLWHPHIDPNITNDGGDTAYDIACRSGPLGALFEILEESLNIY